MKKKIEELFRLAMKAQEKTSAYVSFETSNHGWGCVVTENLIEIAWKYESLKVEYDFLTNTDSMSWKHLFVAWANEFEELHGSKNWNEIDEDYYETIERFAEEKIMGWAGKKKRIVVGRHMEGITLNPLEWLLSNDGAEIMTFNSVDEAKGFLKGKGYQEEDMEFLRFVEEWM